VTNLVNFNFASSITFNARAKYRNVQANGQASKWKNLAEVKYFFVALRFRIEDFKFVI
jgi:hypothetical protein